TCCCLLLPLGGSPSGSPGSSCRGMCLVLSHSTSTTLYSSMVALASSTDECPFFPKQQPRLNHYRLYSNQSRFNQKSLLTWMLRRGMRDVDLKSLWTACPITTFPARIFSIYRRGEYRRDQIISWSCLLAGVFTSTLLCFDVFLIHFKTFSGICFLRPLFHLFIQKSKPLLISHFQDG
uniref:Uncharacterized protein n=1 Tax=Oncorhynchus tshawytscha TaxID=74940 RepID=A0A8C8CMJ3_ONCTS